MTDEDARRMNAWGWQPEPRRCGVAAVLAFGLLVGVVAHALPEDEPPHAPEFPLHLILPSPTPTPWEFGLMEVTSSGNVNFPTKPIGLFIRGQAPVEILPARCRDDFRDLPTGSAIVCFPDDSMYRKLHPKEE